MEKESENFSEPLSAKSFPWRELRGGGPARADQRHADPLALSFISPGHAPIPVLHFQTPPSFILLLFLFSLSCKYYKWEAGGKLKAKHKVRPFQSTIREVMCFRSIYLIWFPLGAPLLPPLLIYFPKLLPTL